MYNKFQGNPTLRKIKVKAITVRHGKLVLTSDNPDARALQIEHASTIGKILGLSELRIHERYGFKLHTLGVLDFKQPSPLDVDKHTKTNKLSGALKMLHFGKLWFVCLTDLADAELLCKTGVLILDKQSIPVRYVLHPHLHY